MRKQLQPTKKQTKPFFYTALTVCGVGINFGLIWLVAIALLPLIIWGTILTNPETPNE